MIVFQVIYYKFSFEIILYVYEIVSKVNRYANEAHNK